MAKLKTESGSQQWFLRTGDNAEFGPIEENGLKLWAEQARILPGHHVSNDRTHWVPATSVDFLDMNWFIDDGDGDLKGPLNHLAAEALIRSGKFSAAARVIAAEQIDEPEPVAEKTVPAVRPAQEVSAAQVAPAKPGRSASALSPRERDELTRACDAVTAERDGFKAECEALKTAEAEVRVRMEELDSKVKLLEKMLRESKNEQRQLEERYVSSEDHLVLSTENTALRRELNAARKRFEVLQEETLAKEAQSDRVQSELADAVSRLAGSEKKIQEAVRARESALQQSRESERSFARLLSDANKRDIDYKAQIESLKKTSAMSPAATDRFYSDQSAVFQILKREVESITVTMETERVHLEALKAVGMRRLQELEKQRQMLQNHLGSSPVEMTSRVLREQTTDPNAVRLRSELDNLRIAHERLGRQAEERERDLNHKLKVMQADYSKMMDQMLKQERESLSAQQLAEKLTVAERELAEIRRNYEAERRQFVANNNAMAARIGEIESGFKGADPGQVQSAEARGVKLASWMSLKK